MIETRQAGERELVPEVAHYRILLDLPADSVSHQEQALRGVVILQGQPRSLAQRSWTLVQSILIRESGF